MANGLGTMKDSAGIDRDKRDVRVMLERGIQSQVFDIIRIAWKGIQKQTNKNLQFSR